MSENTTPPSTYPADVCIKCFCSQYAPAKRTNLTDTFSSLEIQRMVEKHTGIDIMLMELHEMMLQMHYEYLMRDDEFVWMVRKEAEA